MLHFCEDDLAGQNNSVVKDFEGFTHTIKIFFVTLKSSKSLLMLLLLLNILITTEFILSKSILRCQVDCIIRL